MSKARKLYILAAMAMPLAIVLVVLAWAGGYVRSAVVFGSTSVVWGICYIYIAWKISRRREETRPTAPRISHRRHMVVFERIFWLLLLLGTAASFIKGLISDKPLSLVLEGVWFIIVFGFHLLFPWYATDK